MMLQNYTTFFSLIIQSFFVLTGTCIVKAQAPAKPSASKILQDITKINVLGNVLYMAAHPDDENTTFIAYMANEKLYNTSYLSLTRGDGGQNLIGPEIREHLGMIRTQELLQARRIDGGRQFFSRANDFGFSKTSDETLRIWDREKVLSDAVWVIRMVRPDVIVTRFPPDARAGHGHHSASAILAEEAFEAAADPKRFPDQLKYVEPWQATRLVWNLGVWSFSSKEEFLQHAVEFLGIDVGTFNPLFGKSYGEISAESRSMHKSQGFGTVGVRGSTMEYFRHTKGIKATKDLFDGVNTTWSRVKGSARIEPLIRKIVQEYKASNPALSVPALVEVRKEILKLPDGHWKRVKLDEVDGVIKSTLGLFMEVSASRFDYTPGDRLDMKIEAINRSGVPVSLRSLRLPFQSRDSIVSIPMKKNESIILTLASKIPDQTPISQPYWLREGIGDQGLFIVNEQKEIGLPENLPAASVHFSLDVAGITIPIAVPVVFKKRDAVAGEVYQPMVVTPPVFLNLGQEVYMFTNNEPKPVTVKVKSGKAGCRGSVSLALPSGWLVNPGVIPFDLESSGAEQAVTFRVTPPSNPMDVQLKVVAKLEGKEYDRGIGQISYGHIPTQIYFPEAVARAVKIDLIRKSERIGYIMGAGDVVPSSLRQIGYQVVLLGEEDITTENLAKFDAVIVGVRAYNTVERLRFYQPILLEYVKNGGNMIVQYNTNGGLILDQPGPYPFVLSRDRVTVEDAPVRLLKPEHSVLNYPNKITSVDFEGWVQERGLYFPSQWDSAYDAVISSNDPASPALDGGILVAKYGKGNYIYTSLSWFRELPAGVPGAYRLFVNLISIGK